MLCTYSVSDLIPYINWTYFFHAWGIPPHYARVAKVHGCDACRRQWISSFAIDEQPKASEALSLYSDAQRELSRMSGHVSIHCVVELYPAVASGDDILIRKPEGDKPFVLPMLRQQTPGSDGYCLSTADFIYDEACGKTDTIGIFATSVSQTSPQVSASSSIRRAAATTLSPDDYHTLMMQTLSDRLAEAGAERLHEYVRKELWGYAPNESLSIDELHTEQYQGIRPAVGYPCLPDISLNFLLSQLIDFDAVGISLTEHGMMIPHASVSGLMLSSPYARYFAVGTVLDDQLADYARRRGMPLEEMRKYIK